MSRSIARCRDTGGVARRQGSERKKTATSAETVPKAKKRLDRNPRRSGRKMTRELNISQYAIRQILKKTWSKAIQDPKSAKSYRSTKTS